MSPTSVQPDNIPRRVFQTTARLQKEVRTLVAFGVPLTTILRTIRQALQDK